MKAIFIIGIIFGFNSLALGMVKTKEFVYEVDGQKFQGFVASGASKKKKAPGVLVVHEWWGHNEYARERAKDLAKEGFVALALDMFGKGKTAGHPKKAQEFAQEAMSDMELARKRFVKALEILKEREDVSGDKLAAIGFCFGGGVTLQMARLGVDLDLVASFHGPLPSGFEMPKRKDNPKILIFNGAEDPMVTKEQIKNFGAAMKKAEVEYVFANYPDAKHAFTNPKADKYGKKFDLPLEYNEKAAKESWQKLVYELKNL